MLVNVGLCLQRGLLHCPRLSGLGRQEKGCSGCQLTFLKQFMGFQSSRGVSGVEQSQLPSRWRRKAGGTRKGRKRLRPGRVETLQPVNRFSAERDGKQTRVGSPPAPCLPAPILSAFLSSAPARLSLPAPGEAGPKTLEISVKNQLCPTTPSRPEPAACWKAEPASAPQPRRSPRLCLHAKPSALTKSLQSDLISRQGPTEKPFPALFLTSVWQGAPCCQRSLLAEGASVSSKGRG